MSGKEPYFAPPAVGELSTGETPTWGEDAEAIAREAGLGSYGADTVEQESREEALLRSLDRVSGDVAGLRGVVAVLCAAVFTLGALVAWLVVRALWF